MRRETEAVAGVFRGGGEEGGGVFMRDMGDGGREMEGGKCFPSA